MVSGRSEEEEEGEMKTHQQQELSQATPSKHNQTQAGLDAQQEG